MQRIIRQVEPEVPKYEKQKHRQSRSIMASGRRENGLETNPTLAVGDRME
jgi:hypothetical protein